VLVPLGLGECSTAAAPAPNPPACVHYSGFELSLVSDRGGQSSPVKAAKWFAIHGGEANIPTAGWSEEGHDKKSVTVYSGKTILHVTRGRDATWLVDSGQHCS
jgi:hypothetical protein